MIYWIKWQTRAVKQFADKQVFRKRLLFFDLQCRHIPPLRFLFFRIHGSGKYPFSILQQVDGICNHPMRLVWNLWRADAIMIPEQAGRPHGAGDQTAYGELDFPAVK